MTIGSVPIRERLVLPRRQNVPLQHVFTADASFPEGTTASVYLYDIEETALAFWPLTVSGATLTMDVDGEDWWPYRAAARSFTVFVVYPSAPTKQIAWYEGAALRMV